MSEPSGLEAIVAPFIDDLPADRTLWVGLSGGLDSCVLLALAADACRRRGRTLRAIHVHHGLQPAADDFARHSRALCREQGVALKVVRVNVDLAGKGIEAAARAARYQAFMDVMEPGDHLWLAQHADDQAETFWLAALRRSGVMGLAGMPIRRQQQGRVIVRPLLSVGRLALEKEAARRRLAWVEDPSNQNLSLDRNFLRHRLVPSLLERWPDALQALSASARHAGEAVSLLEEYAQEDLDRLGGDPARLPLNGLLALSRPRQRWLLGWCLRCLDLATPPGTRLDEIMSQCRARRDAEVRIHWSGGEARCWRGTLYLLADSRTTPVSLPEMPWWSGREVVVAGRTLALVAPPGQARCLLTLRARQGGERIRLEGRGRRDVKRLLQEAAVPPWQRCHIVLLWRADECVAVLDAASGAWIAVAQGWTAIP